MSRFTAALIGFLGRTFITTGLLILAFAAFQLWGTGWHEARAQQQLADQFADAQAAYEAQVETAPVTEEPDTETDADGDGSETDDPVVAADPVPIVLAPDLAESLLPDLGDGMGRIIIPTIGVDKEIIRGVRRDDLRAGPGHYPETPMPGQPGNAAIAGHRTTYGAPFGDLDRLIPGDLIEVVTVQGTFYYEVEGHRDNTGETKGHFIVSPSEVEVLEDKGDNRLTLTACHPKRSAAQRIVVTASLTSPPAPLIESPITEPTDEPEEQELAEPEPVEELSTVSDDALDTLGWQPAEARPTLLWAAITAAVAAVAWLIGRRWNRWLVYVAATVPFTAALFVCFTHLDRWIPAF